MCESGVISSASECSRDCQVSSSIKSPATGAPWSWDYSQAQDLATPLRSFIVVRHFWAHHLSHWFIDRIILKASLGTWTPQPLKANRCAWSFLVHLWFYNLMSCSHPKGLHLNTEASHNNAYWRLILLEHLVLIECGAISLVSVLSLMTFNTNHQSR